MWGQVWGTLRVMSALGLLTSMLLGERLLVSALLSSTPGAGKSL